MTGGPSRGSVLTVALTLAVAMRSSPVPAADRSPEDGTAMATTTSMRDWARAVAEGATGDLERLRALHRGLLGPRDHAMVEITEPTPTAAEAFATRRADCVGFALLLVGLGRSVGVDVRFLLSPGIEETAERGSLRIQRRHLAAVFAGRVFDLGGESELRSGLELTIPDRTALALYRSNRGVQRLASGDADGAAEELWSALRLDPTLDSTWTNLGVALRRAGDPDGALLAYQMALRIDPDDDAARRNLGVALLSGEPP